MSFEEYYQSLKSEVEEELERVVPPETLFPPAIHQSIRYSVFAGGKRLRPVLVLTATETVGGDKQRALPFAAAVELIHTYTLIHDDLPALDNDDFRRGVPTNHQKFGEANAVLAGDALLTLAFEVMSDVSLGEPISEKTRLSAIHEISSSIGTVGTIGGQVLDLELQGKEADLASLEYIHTHKTGYLILGCLRIGGILGEADEEQLKRLSEYGKNVGLAFQIVDDILDVEGDQKQLGKEVGADERNQKVTYPAVLGMKKSKDLAKRLIDMGLRAVDGFGPRGQPLKDIAEYVLARKI